MPDNTFLSATELYRLQPSLTQDFDLEEGVLAYTELGVPLAWLLMFRQEHYITQTFRHGKRDVTASGLIAPHSEVLPLLDEGFAILQKLDAKTFTPIAPLIAIFRDFIKREEEDGVYLTIEWQDHPAFAEEGGLLGDVQSLLRLLGGQTYKASSVLRYLSRVCGIDFDKPILSPAEIRLSPDVQDAALQNMVGILGTELYRPVPWEE